MNPSFTYVWELFLPVAKASQMDVPADADAAWLISKGIEPEAPSVLLQYRDKVLPLIRSLERRGGLEWYSFLIHGYASGVPTMADDPRAFIHLRLSFSAPLERFPDDWSWPRPVQFDFSQDIAGLSGSSLDMRQAWRLIGEQSKWFLSLLEQQPTADGLTLVKHTRQFLHFFANMAQMRVM